MKRQIRLLAVLALVTMTGVAMLAPHATAVNVYGGPCDAAEDLDYLNPNWNELCEMYIEMWEACCAAGTCSCPACG